MDDVELGLGARLANALSLSKSLTAFLPSSPRQCFPTGTFALLSPHITPYHERPSKSCLESDHAVQGAVTYKCCRCHMSISHLTYCNSTSVIAHPPSTSLLGPAARLIRPRSPANARTRLGVNLSQRRNGREIGVGSSRELPVSMPSVSHPTFRWG
jgi:hypothetical protein